MKIDELDTPCILVDLDRLEANITRLQAYMDTHGIANRPHIKTHKIPAVAQMQTDAGAVGITCQKLGEAEVMAKAGMKDIFLPYNIIGASKLKRLVKLAQQVRMSVTADSAFVVEGLAEVAHNSGISLTVLVECDTGGGRCGVQTPEDAGALARLIYDAAGLHFGGLMTYPSSVQANTFVEKTKELLARDNIPVERVSGGSTSCMWEAHTFPAITEHRAGMYIYGDRYVLKSGAMGLEDISFRVLATVVSRPTVERGILDAGSKTLSSDKLGLDGFGSIVEYPQARIYSLSEEHGIVDFSDCERKPAIGERVQVVANHCCPVSNLLDVVHGHRGELVEVTWEVAARGKVG